jgi:hypothetical protein
MFLQTNIFLHSAFSNGGSLLLLQNLCPQSINGNSGFRLSLRNKCKDGNSEGKAIISMLRFFEKLKIQERRDTMKENGR